MKCLFLLRSQNRITQLNIKKGRDLSRLSRQWSENDRIIVEALLYFFYDFSRYC